MVDYIDVIEAYERVSIHANKTPVMTSRTIDKMTGCNVFFKCENMQRGGAFKFRGAFNAISQLTDEEKNRGIIAHSSGNHAQAVSLVSAILGVKAIIVMPENSPQVKLEATRGYDAEVVLCEPTPQGRVQKTNELIEKYGYHLVHPYDNPVVIAGAGTACYELLQEVGCLNYVFAPVGGGGLVSGSSIALKGKCSDGKIIAVEPENADDAYRSFHSGEIHPSINPNTIADGLRTQLAPITFDIVRRNVEEIILVSEKEILEAMRLLWERMKLVVEPSGAVSLAGLLKKSSELEDQRVGVIISGGNIDLSDFFNHLHSLVSE